MRYSADQYYVCGLKLKNGPKFNKNLKILLGTYPHLKCEKIDGTYYLTDAIKIMASVHGRNLFLDKNNKFHISYEYDPDYSNTENTTYKNFIELLGEVVCMPIGITPDINTTLNELDLIVGRKKYYNHYIVNSVLY